MSLFGDRYGVTDKTLKTLAESSSKDRWNFYITFTDALAVPPPAIAAGQPGSVATDSRLESGW